MQPLNKSFLPLHLSALVCKEKFYKTPLASLLRVTADVGRSLFKNWNALLPMESLSCSQIVWLAEVNSVAFSFYYRCNFKYKQNETKQKEHQSGARPTKGNTVCLLLGRGQSGWKEYQGEAACLALICQKPSSVQHVLSLRLSCS